ncbi:hypothetical protein N7454_008358 [Penicillium verhagenii]|nr:hypothetical protein N7454_008358 [Penicillium verhagenii]
MSITSRSQSSSPDVLGPPGDAEYLISSPIKPFTGRQSWMSPAIGKRQLTPAKRPRTSLSPGKSAHSIRFNDILLPGSPSRKLNGRQLSLSPERIQQDGNVSPWRIRVTLEATQDDENQIEASPSRKRRRPSTVTTMIPLKDERSPLIERTPARKRGRPRKSDALPQNGSPWPGSPGHTPGPNEPSTEKRKRGRPRKGTPKPKQLETVIPEDAPSPAQPWRNMSPMDMTADVANEAGAGRQLSPINLAVDGGVDSDSLGADDLPVANLRMPTPSHGETWDHATTREYGRASYDTPIIGETEHHFQDDDRNLNSTPSKMPSPTRERLGSSTRSSRRGTTSSPRTYPSPSPTSSPGEEENEAREDHLHETEVTNDQPHLTSDAIEDHEEFDSIMESEGFTMVSLDTSPRPNKKGRIGERLKRKLGGGIDDLRSDTHSSARPSPLVHGPSPVSQSSQHNQSLSIHPKRQSSSQMLSYPDLPTGLSPERPQRPEAETYQAEDVHFQRDIEYDADVLEQQNQDEMEMEEARIQQLYSIQPKRRNSPPVPFYSHHSTESSPEQPPIPEADIYESEEDDHPQHDIEYDADELEQQSQHELDMEEARFESSHSTRNIPPQYSSPGLSPARDYRWQADREAVSRHAADPKNTARLIYINSDESASHHEEADHNALTGIRRSAESEIEGQLLDEEPLYETLDDEPPFRNLNQSPRQHLYEPLDEERVDDEPDEEPFHENLNRPFHQPVHGHSLESVDAEPLVEEPVDEFPEYSEPETSRVPFNPGQRVELEHDVVEEDNESVDIWQQEGDAEPSVEDEPESTRSHQSHSREREIEPEMAEDDGFDDIWQQEARDESYLSQHSDDHVSPVQESKSPWQRIARTSAHQDSLSSSPAYVTVEHDDNRYFDQTHIRKLRDQEVDLSALLAEDDTPNRARYYNATSTPRSILRRPGPQSSINGSAMKSVSRKTEKRVRLQPISQSPEGYSEAEMNSPVALQNSQFESPPKETTANGSVSGSELHDNESAHDTTTTPKHPRAEEEPEATWFQRITSLTPRWLKAPPKSRYDDTSSEASEGEPQYEESDQEEPETLQSAPEIREEFEHDPPSSPSHQSSDRQLDESAESPPMDEDDHLPSIEEDAEDPWIQPEVPDDAVDDNAAVDNDKLERPNSRPRPPCRVWLLFRCSL